MPTSQTADQLSVPQGSTRTRAQVDADPAQGEAQAPQHADRGWGFAPIIKALATAREIIRLPWQTVTLGCEPLGRHTYLWLTSNHLTWPVIPYKCFGVAMMPVPQDHATFLAGSARKNLRNKIHRARKAGFTCRRFDPFARHGEILEIYRSTPERQGHAVNYEAGPFAQMMEDRPERFYGIFDRHDRLRGFTCPLVTGELAWMRVCIGHHDDLREGIMYAVVSFLVDELSRERQRTGRPLWLMHDFWYGKSEGMRYFIRHCGFDLCNVRWRQAHFPPPEIRSPTAHLAPWERF
jgi:hypothetical protein